MTSTTSPQLGVVASATTIKASETNITRKVKSKIDHRKKKSSSSFNWFFSGTFVLAKSIDLGCFSIQCLTVTPFVGLCM